MKTRRPDGPGPAILVAKGFFEETLGLGERVPMVDDPHMTPKEKAIVKALVAIAWADGEMQEPEGGVIEGLLSGFDASPEEEAEVLLWATSPRRLEDVDVTGLDRDDRELLLS